VRLSECPLTHPPPEIVEQGREAILNYFEEIDTQGVARLFEAKVLVVGEGRAGKTSLVRRLYQPDLPLPSEDETTKGIEVHRHEFRMEDGRAFRLNVWDFGGQQIYHATHQFFLTKSSL
jgi:GTPase SAR1 family protein